MQTDGDLRDGEDASLDQTVLLIDTVVGISSSLDPQSTLDSIVRAAAALAGAHIASIWLESPDGLYRARASHGVPLDALSALHLNPGEGLIGELRANRQPVQVVDFVRDVETEPDAVRQAELTGIRATLAIPLQREGDVVGALYVARREARGFDRRAIAMLEQLALFAQVALSNAQRFTTVEARRDRLQACLDAIPEGIIVFDREGRVDLVNRTLERELGQNPGILSGDRQAGRETQRIGTRTVRFRYDPRAVHQRVLATGNPETALLEMDQPPCVYEIHFNPLPDPSGEIEGVVATLRDITLPLELERERARSSLLTHLFDLSADLNSTMPVPVLTRRVVEAAMELVDACSGMIGLAAGSELHFDEICIAGQWHQVDVSLRPGEGLGGHVWETGRPYVANDRSTDPHVSPALQERFGFRRSLVVPMIDRSGRFVGALHVHDPRVERDFGRADVEALQLLANQAVISLENTRLSALKDEFLSIVSHELKTPVTSIKGFTQILQRRLSPESRVSAGRYLDVLNHQADRLSSLINDLLDLSRIQRGRFQFDLEAVDYSALLADVVEEMRLVAGHHRLSLEVPDGVAVHGNAHRLRQVLVNLIDNAFTYGPEEGGVEITVDAQGEEVTTCVRDEGPGIPAAEAEHIFSPYYQMAHVSTRGSKGLGLGLYVCRQIVEEHGGRIWLGSEHRTTFCFTLPRDGTA